MPCFVFVAPSGDGWIVRGDFDDGPLEFATGARAEQAARDLCHRLSDAGEPVVLEIRLRNGERAGRFLFPAYLAEPTMPVALRA
ncbi:hypothetical protein [Caulobacter sp. FWC2]|jgi:hypothetical protein|uniref:hypothetical protein n=1 Tax=Caulobacter sp. FWC2 TaxID=69664 RepID=UPI000C14A33A|nr:hypothetical protein [Caulobacter sp. FWC2]PIB89990.1 hypothetical protein CSW62_25490 [Caulobacter sp. FWC2]